MRKACRIATYVSCRSHLENFGKVFVRKHRTKASQRVCKFNFCNEENMTEVFAHFEICTVVSNDEKMLLVMASAVILQVVGIDSRPLETLHLSIPSCLKKFTRLIF